MASWAELGKLRQAINSTGAHHFKQFFESKFLIRRLWGFNVLINSYLFAVLVDAHVQNSRDGL